MKMIKYFGNETCFILQEYLVYCKVNTSTVLSNKCNVQGALKECCIGLSREGCLALFFHVKRDLALFIHVKRDLSLFL